MIESLYSFIFSFEFFNFLYIAGVFVYLYKNKVVPSLVTAIQKKKDFFKGLEEQVVAAQNEQLEILEHIEEQELYGQELLDRIKAWQVIVNQQNSIYENQKQVSRKLLIKFTEQQQEALVLQHIQREMAPCIIREATIALEKKFSPRKAQDGFIESAYQALQKETL